MVLRAVSGMKLPSLYLSKLVFLVWTGMEAGGLGWAPMAGVPTGSIKELTWGWDPLPVARFPCTVLAMCALTGFLACR